MSASSSSPTVLTTSAALGPAFSMRMSSGPSKRNEKPRSASSICGDETPRSSATPSRSEEHTSELQSLMRISYAVFCLKKKKTHQKNKQTQEIKKNQKTEKTPETT